MNIIRIESQKNAEYKKLLSFHQPQKARKEGVFILEGVRAVSELPPDWTIRSLWIADTYQGPMPAVDHVFQVPDALFQKAAETVHSQGILAVVDRKERKLQDLSAEGGLWIILENLQDPGNAGTILRTADACGAAGVLCTRGTVDFYNSKVIRSCMGSLFHIPFVTVEGAQEAVDFVHAQGGQVIGTHLRTDLTYTSVSYAGPTAILIGNEGAGMSEEAAVLCDRLVRIPMPGRAESLNAGIAAGVMMYEVLRQRGL